MFCDGVRCVCRLLAQGLVMNVDPSGGPGSLGPVAELREDEDEAYFGSYGHYSIHEDMLKVHTHTQTPQRKFVASIPYI